MIISSFPGPDRTGNFCLPAGRNLLTGRPGLEPAGPDFSLTGPGGTKKISKPWKNHNLLQNRLMVMVFQKLPAFGTHF